MTKKQEQFYDTLSEQTGSIEATLETVRKAGDGAIRWLVYGLTNPSKRIRQNSAAALKAIGNEQVIEELERRLWRINFEYVQEGNQFETYTIEVLSEIPGERSINLLMRLARNSELTHEAMKAIEKLGGAQAVETVAKSLIKYHRLDRWLRFFMWLWLLICCTVGYSYASHSSTYLEFICIFLGAAILIFSFSLAFIEGFRKIGMRQYSVRSLAKLSKRDAIGTLALCSRDRALRKQAVESLIPLLDAVDESSSLILTAEQIDALNALLSFKLDVFQRTLIHALPYLGNEKTLEGLKELAANDKRPTELRALAAQAIPKLEEQLARRAEQRTLLRASNHDETNTLLRPADVKANISDEQLLRVENRE